MIKKLYEEILNGTDVRKNLIELRKELKDKANKYGFLYHLAGDYSVFYDLLESEDAKTRKNAALIMGELGEEAFLQPLYKAYKKEHTLFVKSDYLTALQHLDYRSLLEGLKERQAYLINGTFEEASMKHIHAELKLLTEMILDVEGTNTHTFIGYEEMSDLILLTNRDYQAITLEQIQNGKAKAFNAGVLVRTKDLREILEIRTYSELLFRLSGTTTVANDPIVAAGTLCAGGLLNFLEQRHKGEAPYYFRLEIKTKQSLDKKSIFAKKLALELEKCSGRALINSTSNYEIEIRLIENKEGQFNVLLKLYTLKDERFSYRKHAVAASIQPVQAALIANLAKPYLKEKAQVLDPFCGVGTMLIERNKLVSATPMYGIDHFGEAIDKAIDNARRDGCIINFINRDFFDFKHDYLFDEIFTNMPTRGGRRSEDEMFMLYDEFFKKAAQVLKNEAVIVMYTRDQSIVSEKLRQYPAYKVEKLYEISKREEAYLYILKFKG